MRILSAAHDQASSDTQKIYEYIAVPTIIIPLIMAPVEAMGHEESWMTYVTMLAFITTGVLSGVNVFFKFKEKSINHADEQRVPFSNLLDDIGGQELQSSGQFLLCQLRQTSSRDTTAQLLGFARTRS